MKSFATVDSSLLPHRRSLLLLGLWSSLALGTGRDCYLQENGALAAETRLPDIEGKAGAVLRFGSESKTLPATNFYYEGNNARPRFGKLVNTVLSRLPEQSEAISQEMTARLGDLGMDFVVKDERGMYTKRHQVPVHAMALPMDAQYYRELNQSTEPYLLATRAFLQSYLASSDRPNVDEVMAKGKLPPAMRPQVAELLAIVNQSIYQLPGLHGPHMAEYPVLAGPVGFDAVLANMNKAEGIFFEPNKGTPSGITNLTKLLESLREADPAQFSVLAEAMVENKTFALFRQAIESGAKQWTGVEGISVVIGPGEYNGAHPDVSSISMLTGMPLVKPGELYTGGDGYLYLNTGEGQKHPRVTGIYSRMEESFILQDGADLSRGASPMIQTFVDNAELSRKIGVPLRDGVWYEYQYEDNDITKPVVGVAMDSSGQPKIATALDRVLGPRPDGKPSGSLRDAIAGRKVYLNNVGGRLVDNKRAFTLLHQIGQHFRGNLPVPVAGPPRSLTREQWSSEFLNNWNSDQWVVKIDDASGGDGVYIFANMSTPQRQEVAGMIQDALAGRSNQGYEIQYFTTSASQVSTRRNADGSIGYSNRVVDLRIFPFFFADGHVDSGSTGALVRTAPAYSAKANTSAGGGYGILAVMADAPQNLPREKILPQAPRQSAMGVNSQQQLAHFVRRLRQVMDAIGSGEGAARSVDLKTFAIETKRVMNVVGWKYQVFRARAEQYAQGEIPFARFAADMQRAYQEFAQDARSGNDPFLAQGAQAIIRAGMR